MAPDLLARAQRIANEVLAPKAGAVDQAERVPDGHLQALADAGLFGIAAPPEHGGPGIDAPTFRRIVAAVGGGCGATFFVWVQHHGVVRTLLESTNAELIAAELPALVRGEHLAGTAFAHVRRSGPLAVRATRVDGGWRLDGRAPWATSWGLADRFTVAAIDPDAGTLVWSLVDGHDVAGMNARPLPLPVFGATRTVVVDFEGCEVADDRVIAVEDLDAWRRRDRARAAHAQPAVLGVVERAIRSLEPDPSRADPDAQAASTALRGRLDVLWSRDDELLRRAVGGGDVIADAAAHRADALALAGDATRALLAATGGRGMALDHPAQRLAREAAFYVIQAQTGDGRSATLRAV